MPAAVDQHLSIPVIDLEPTRTGTPEQAAQTAKKVYEAFKNIGFAYIKNHGVPQELVDEAFGWVSMALIVSILRPTSSKTDTHMLCRVESSSRFPRA